MESQIHSCSTQKRLSTLLPQTASPCWSGCPEELLHEMWNPRNGKIMPVTSAAHGQTHIAVGARKEIQTDHVLVHAVTPGMRMRDSAWIRPRKCIPTTDSPNEFGQWRLLFTVKLDSTQIFEILLSDLEFGKQHEHLGCTHLAYVMGKIQHGGGAEGQKWSESRRRGVTLFLPGWVTHICAMLALPGSCSLSPLVAAAGGSGESRPSVLPQLIMWPWARFLTTTSVELFRSAENDGRYYSASPPGEFPPMKCHEYA